MDVTLPSEAGNLDDPPSITVYTSDNPNGPFLTVSDGFSSNSMFWGLAEVGSGALQVRIRQAVAGWYYWVIVVY